MKMDSKKQRFYAKLDQDQEEIIMDLESEEITIAQKYNNKNYIQFRVFVFLMCAFVLGLKQCGKMS